MSNPDRRFVDILAGPPHSDPIVDGYEIVYGLSSGWPEHEGRQAQTLIGCLRNPVRNILFAHRLCDKMRPANEAVVPKSTIVLDVELFHIFPIEVLELPDGLFLRSRFLWNRSEWRLLSGHSKSDSQYKDFQHVRGQLSRERMK